ELAALDAVLRPLAAPGTARDHARRLAALLDAGGVRRRAARGPAALAARDLAALARLEEAADAVSRALALAGRGDARLDAGAYHALLGLAVEESALPPAADPAAAAVELSGLDEAPGLSARAAVLVGCAEGAFPPAPPPEPLLRDPERIALAREVRRTGLPTAAARRAEALHRAFCAVAAGREAIAFTWAASGPDGAGGPLAPLVSDALAAIGVAPAPRRGEPRLTEARTAREALRAAARAGPRAAAALAAADARLAPRLASALARGEIEARRREALRARRAAPCAGAIAGPALAALRAELPAEWSPTDLEGYARCPFRLFLQLAARLPDRDAGDLDQNGRDEGSLLHAVLEQVVAERMARRAWPPDGSDADLAAARAVAGRVLAAFEAEGRTGDPAVWGARREAVLARLDRVVRAEARDHDGLAPALVEHRFGGSSGVPAVAVSAGGDTVLLKGRIDRVDASGDRLRVIDYKNARQANGYAALLDPEALGETSFQVPAYLLAASRALPGRTRLEATYALLRKAARVEPLAVDPGDPLLAATAHAAADGPRTFAAGVVSAVQRIRAGEFPIAPRACEGCAFGAVCRSEGAAAAADADDAEGGGA
ncbi:MAG TPA: PD-(D/E)XK nuclease family protein, partial [Anaeromyxobacter sp.]|nr:PD-(D/E)XK nuclease family protein [Anaeromyxobacter sp.]